MTAIDAIEMSEALPCGCRVTVRRPDNTVTIHACSDDHAEKFWMRWYVALNALEANDDSDGQVCARP